MEEWLYLRAIKDDTTAAIFLLKSLRPEVYREVIRTEAKNFNVNVDGSPRAAMAATFDALSDEAKEKCLQAQAVLKRHLG